MAPHTRWRKLGLVFYPTIEHPLLLTHAANPLAVHQTGDLYRVFFSGRDKDNRSSVGYFDFDLGRREVIYVHDQPAFSYGSPDSFYSDGVSVGCVYEVGGQRFMPFMGWQTRPGAHWRGDIGRLVVAPDFSLSLAEDSPLLGTAPEDPISLSYPWVERTSKDRFEMWYGSTVTWDAGNGEMLHVLKHATSTDGHRWDRHGVSVPFQIGQAQAFSRPTVISDRNGGFLMWFSYRSGLGPAYRIGHAVSDDGNSWTLKLDEAGIDVSETGWDAEMIAYPFVFRHDGEIYMLYNGNGYGRSGIGLARLESRGS